MVVVGCCHGSGVGCFCGGGVVYGFGELVVEWQWWVYGFGCCVCVCLSVGLVGLLGGLVGWHCDMMDVGLIVAL